MKVGWELPSLWPTPRHSQEMRCSVRRPQRGPRCPWLWSQWLLPDKAKPGARLRRGGWGRSHPTRGRLWESVG